MADEKKSPYFTVEFVNNCKLCSLLLQAKHAVLKHNGVVQK